MSNPFNKTKAYALLICVNENQEAKWALPAIKKDVELLNSVLIDANTCAYDKNKIKIIDGKDATRKGILDGLTWLGDQLKTEQEATGLLYYTGHGAVEDGVSFFIPYDIDGHDITSSALRASDFATRVNKFSPERLLILLDCCHAQAMDVKSVGEKQLDLPSATIDLKAFNLTDSRTIGTKSISDSLESGKGRVVINSCRKTESSYIYLDKGISAFTCHLIEALTGHFPLMEGQTTVTVANLISYVEHTVPEQVKKKLGGDQHPEAVMNGSFPIAMLLGGKGIVKGSAPPNIDAVLAQAALSSISQTFGDIKIKNSNNVSIGNTGTVNQTSTSTDNRRIINTGGGLYNEGNLNVSGDFVGRDKNTSYNYYGNAGQIEGELRQASPAARAKIDKLYEVLGGFYFDNDDLADLAFRLNIGWDDLSGETKRAKARSLVHACFKQGDLDALYQLVKEARPKLGL